MLDFTKIISGVAGQRDTFEELVCQVARRVPPPGYAEFRRIHGAGGDGGVEAVWILTTGDEHGYQAKFYTKSGDVDWSAIDNSVATALATHPRLTTMIIAIACALTGRTQRVTKKGQPQANGWDAWDQHKARWEASAKALGRNVAFVPWTAPDLEEMLTRVETTGLTAYWFGGIELSPEWLARQCQRTVAALEERYHPEDHVDVSTSQVFDGLLRNLPFRTMLRRAREDVLENGRLGATPESLLDAEKQKLTTIAEKIRKFDEATAILELNTDSAFDYTNWRDQAVDLRKRVFEVIQAVNEIARAAKAKRPSTSGPHMVDEDREWPSVDYFIEALRKLQSSLGQFLEAVDSPGSLSDQCRFALLDGRAGSGKSHLIASQVERALGENAPALFLLGTDFTLHGTIENQMIAHFELGGSKFDQFLGALNARAEALGKRALIAIDAVNEGAGVQLWRSALQGLAQRILAYPRLALCVSCRREYVDHLVTPAVNAIATRAEVTGFETPEEIEAAARVYMDRRGIVRPATPWLNPEFSNPLFLRTACLAIERDGRTTFPRGMRGTSEVLNFLLDSTGRHLGTSYDGADTLVGPVRRALLALAGAMASDQRDYITRGRAHTLVEAVFQGFAPPPSKTWLELLRFRGLLRYDPNPAHDPADPLSDQDDVLRISFQRFQDHLVANALLQHVADPAGLFDAGGSLSFVLGKHGVQWEWRGLFYALFLHFADRYQVELVDLLPGGADAWWDQWPVQDAYIDSIRWRTVGAFSDRTLELLNRLDCHDENIIALLIELAVVENHPWNAELLDRNLACRKLPHRDAFWTRRINTAHNDAGHPLTRLINWCLNLGIGRAEDGTLGLALVLLAWACTSSSANVRDTASKAMIHIFLERPALIEPLFIRFATCDDPYVVERLFGALYGASLRTPDPARLAGYAITAWRHAFGCGQPPVHILTRDYARGVIELSASAGGLDPSIDLVRCRPPYGTKAPAFNLTEAKVEARAKRVGADSILRSCYKGLADFGRYTLQYRVERFAAAPLKGPRPLTSAETGQAFLEDVSRGRPDIAKAFEALRDAHRLKRISFDADTFKMTVPASDRKRIEVAEETLLALLTATQARRYASDAKRWAANETDHAWIMPGKGLGKQVDAHRAKLWVANRAIALGWTEAIFPRDHTSGEGQGDRGRVERIGKKYQRIAMMELLARLADNNWLKPDWGSLAKTYSDPLDVEFIRDIEPSVLPGDNEMRPAAGMPDVPLLRCPDLAAGEREAWVLDPELAPQRLALALGADLGSGDWLTLYRYASHDVEAPRRKGSWDVSWEQSDFHFIAMLLMPPRTRERFVEETEKHRDDFHEWLPGNVTDGPYIGELGRRATWRSDPWSTLDARGRNTDRSYGVIKPTIGYQWESHLDESLGNGFSRQVPIPWLITALGLRPDIENVGVYADSQGLPIIVSGRDDRHSYILVRRAALLAMARRNEVEPVWTVIGERSARTEGNKRTSDVRVRYNGSLWLDADIAVLRHWSRSD
ncbi:hypothetical protein KYK30_17115 [Shinella yambaruensis]|uniref:ATP-binding protein n=1 Tax=Shinella yambaruensis TaxID=415996 RepID=A0ABQ5ZN79_9HYPH|nr:hypothetical protein [Shinella yambaruensis]MCJ8028361.1 hypothetical protein [Shinella yambaruensis]MCU7981414.1 hypothetical protein [Shinella yambaruensis]GLR53556.1 hypothetical protein GCM10007923_47710 [Shinella yambaruensis]